MCPLMIKIIILFHVTVPFERLADEFHATYSREFRPKYQHTIEWWRKHEWTVQRQYECHNQRRLVTHQSKQNNNICVLNYPNSRRKTFLFLSFTVRVECVFLLSKLLFNYAICCDLFSFRLFSLINLKVFGYVQEK